MTDMTEEVEAPIVEVPRRNWAACARRPVQWTETFAIDGDPKKGVMLTVLYMADRLAADAEVTLEATLIVRGEARATVAVPVTGVPGWRWVRLFTWADQALMGIEAEERAQTIVARPVRQRTGKTTGQAAAQPKSKSKAAAKPATKRARKAPKEQA
jgi:hypothetical protein